MSDGIDKAIFRAAKLKKGRGKSSLGSSWRHQEEHDRVAEISQPENSEENRTRKYFDDMKQLNAFINKAIKRHNDLGDNVRAEKIAKGVEKKKLPRNLRNDAAIACECIFTFSPEMADKIDIDEWRKANVQFINREFMSKGATPIRIDCHMDEATPHIHFLFCPTTKEGKISASEYFGGAKNLSMMQDRYADAMAQFELTRGYSRYSVYKTVQAEAVKEGYSSDFKGVKAYCEDNGLPVPERRRHTSKTEWLAGMEKQISAMEQQKEQLEHEIRLATARRDSVSVKALEKQLDEARARVQYLEAFVERREIAPFYRAYLDEKKQPTRAKTGWEIADEILR